MWFKPKTEIRQIAEALNYKTDQEGIVNRMLRENGAWNSHLEKTKNSILQSALGKTGNCVVLGSGWLLDVPIAELSQQFETVYLVDIVHPAYVKSKIKKYVNVKLVTQDITCGLAFYLHQTRINSMEELVHIVQNRFSPSMEEFYNVYLSTGVPDFVVSVNLLNQLDILLVEYLTEHYNFTNVDYLKLRESIQKTHIKLLPKGKSCLITDFYKNEYNLKSGELSDRSMLIFCDLEFNNANYTWLWNFDSTGTYTENKKVVFEVACFNL